MDELTDHIAIYDGQNTRPLHFVIRTVVTAPPEENDPPGGDPGSVYASLRDEITKGWS
jgi:hypothetical protein